MTRIRHLTLTACALAAALPMAAQADDFRAQVDLAYRHFDFDQPLNPNGDALGAAGTYYFSPVATDGRPLAEAAFLGRSSFVRADAVRSELGDEKIDIFGAAIGYYLPNTIFYGQLNYTYADDFGGDQDRVSGALGVAPIDGLLVTTRFDEDGWDPNATAKYVGKLPNSHWYAASVALAEDEVEDDLAWAASFDYFFDTTFSAGVGLAEDVTTFRAEKFFMPNFSVGAHFDLGNDQGANAYGAKVSWRF
jgi:hypothetical protein